MACVAFSIKHITDEFFLVAAEALSKKVTKQELNEGRVYPNLDRIQEVSLAIAVEVGKYASEKSLCNIYPFPESIENHLKSVIYNTNYTDSLKFNWDFPKL